MTSVVLGVVGHTFTFVAKEDRVDRHGSLGVIPAAEDGIVAAVVVGVVGKEGQTSVLAPI